MKVSVVIPSYNHRDYVVQAIESVLDQSWPDIDLVVVDDGSSDGSTDVIQNLLDRRGGFRFVARRENRGVISTLNEGIALAEGELISFCASDDYLAPGSLEGRADFLIRNPEHVAVFANVARIEEEGHSVGLLVNEKNRRLFTSPDPIPLFLEGINLPLHSIMSRKQVLLDIGGFDPRFRACDDMDLQLLHFLKGSVGFIDEVAVFYRRHEENVSLKIRHLTARDKVMLYRKYLEEVEELKPYHPIIKRKLNRLYRKFGKNLTQGHRDLNEDRNLLQKGWPFAWRNPMLLWYLLQNEFRLRLERRSSVGSRQGL